MTIGSDPAIVFCHTVGIFVSILATLVFPVVWRALVEAPVGSGRVALETGCVTADPSTLIAIVLAVVADKSIFNTPAVVASADWIFVPLSTIIRVPVAVPRAVPLAYCIPELDHHTILTGSPIVLLTLLIVPALSKTGIVPIGLAIVAVPLVY